MRTLVTLSISTVTFLVPLSCFGQVNSWTAAGASNLWNDVDNWSQAVVPAGANQDPGSGWDDPNGVFYPLTPDTSDDFPRGNNNVFLDSPGATTLIDSSVIATAYGVRVGGDRGAPATLEITGGTLFVGVDPAADPSVNAAGWHLDIGRGFNASGDPNTKQQVVMSGGTVVTNGLLIPEQFVDDSLPDPTDSAPLNGELIMSGGVINARWMNLGQLNGNGTAKLSGDAQINIASNVAGDPANGGELSFNRDWFVDSLPVPSSGNVSLDVSDLAIITIFGHQSDTIVSPDQGELNRYLSHVDTHELTAYDGTAAPVILLNTDDGAPFITIEAPTVPGDANRDGVVDLLDLDLLGSNFGSSEADFADGDFNDDGMVDLLDLDVLGANFGTTAGELFPLPPLASAAVPEPAACVLLLLGVASSTGQRRRSSSTAERR